VLNADAPGRDGGDPPPDAFSCRALPATRSVTPRAFRSAGVVEARVMPELRFLIYSTSYGLIAILHRSNM
jgi:hypothetical protein